MPDFGNPFSVLIYMLTSAARRVMHILTFGYVKEKTTDSGATHSNTFIAFLLFAMVSVCFCGSIVYVYYEFCRYAKPQAQVKVGSAHRLSDEEEKTFMSEQ